MSFLMPLGRNALNKASSNTSLTPEQIETCESGKVVSLDSAHQRIRSTQSSWSRHRKKLFLFPVTPQHYTRSSTIKIRCHCEVADIKITYRNELYLIEADCIFGCLLTLRIPLPIC
ncbi:hypothetical protein DR999_PMT15308 [Platysternon megacephalum]|uniref:Uncharacterized protein n=1 Tax=Platysternon megacephalum TaxID=55544 RepID=A0A4D9E2I4_9SAUR|nr:hypothetical protein DR999_PMT15308 [Platysternon megacephalum]